jgi:hypothetical protein
MYELGREIGLPEDAIYPTAQYLDGEGLLEIRTMDGNVSITHSGVIEIEEAIENPERRTEHFPPINIININSMENSVIQQGSHGAIQNANLDTGELREIKRIIDELEKDLQKLDFSGDSLEELRLEMETIKLQLLSPKPKSIILSESLKTIKDLLLSVTANVYTPVIIEWIKAVLKV